MQVSEKVHRRAAKYAEEAQRGERLRLLSIKKFLRKLLKAHFFF
jgi:hypothetical protein